MKLLRKALSVSGVNILLIFNVYLSLAMPKILI